MKIRGSNLQNNPYIVSSYTKYCMYIIVLESYNLYVKDLFLATSDR